MPEEFDPLWEYWEPSAEMREIQEDGNSIVTNDERLGLFEEDNKGKHVLSGYRLSTAKYLRLLRFKSGKEKNSIGSGRQLEQRQCSNDKCGRLFYPSHSTTKYCSIDCILHKGRPKLLPSLRKCPICQQRRRFKPLYTTHRYCSLECANKSFKVVVRGCSECDKPVPKEKCANHNKGKYCSQKCKKKRDNRIQRERRLLSGQHLTS